MPRALPPLKALLAIALLAAAWSAAPAAAQVRRCVDAQGVAVYTDRPCEAMQAAPREAPQDPSTGATLAPGFAVRGCARRPETLLSGVRGALEARDVNRLANWYHWTGTGSGTARALMDELEAIANRPLVSAELVYPENGVGFPSPEYPVSDAASPEVNLTPFLPPAPASDEPAPDTGAPRSPEPSSPPQITAEPGPDPVALRVQQMRGSADIEAVSVDFSLRQNAGCWWIEL